MIMAKVGIVMGSDSDMPVMAKAADILDQLGISYEMRIISAHREPDEFFEYAKTAEEKGFKVIILVPASTEHTLIYLLHDVLSILLVVEEVCGHTQHFRACLQECPFKFYPCHLFI